MPEKAPAPLPKEIVETLISEGFPKHKLKQKPGRWTPEMRQAVVNTIAEWEPKMPGITLQILNFF